MKGISSPPPAILKPVGKLYLSSTIYSLSGSNLHQVTLNTKQAGFDDNIEDIGNNRILPGVAGLYLIIAQISWADTVDPREYELLLKLNGSSYIGRVRSQASTDDELVLTLSTIWPLIETDYVNLFARHFDTTNVADILGGDAYTFLTMLRLR